MPSFSLDNLRNLVEQWLKLPTNRSERHFLETHLELLDPRSEDILTDFITRCIEQPSLA